MICTPSLYVKRFLRFQTLEALLGPAEVMAPPLDVVTPPPITKPPGSNPVTNDVLAGKDTSVVGAKLQAARENPARNVFRISGEITCVSSRLAIWLRKVSDPPNSGSAWGNKPSPSSMV